MVNTNHDPVQYRYFQVARRIRRDTYHSEKRRKPPSTQEEAISHSGSHQNTRLNIAGIGSAIIVAIGMGFMMGFELKSFVSTNDSARGRVRTATGDELLGTVKKTLRKLEEDLRTEYGDYFSIFLEKATVDDVFLLSDASREKFQRRILKKVLTKQINPRADVNFTWIVAGDAVAASSANRIEDSYSSVLELAMRPAFASIGIEFVVANKGTASYGSGPELAWCMLQMYGDDIDVLSHDFAYMDSKSGKDYRAAFWARRQTAHPSHPLLLFIDGGTSTRWRQVRNHYGLGLVLMDMEGIDRFQRRFLSDNSTIAHPETLPSSPKYLCDGVSKDRDHCDHESTPCSSDKDACMGHQFRETTSCEQKRYQSIWMPGWKETRLRGWLLATFLLRLLEEGLVRLDEIGADLTHLPPVARWIKAFETFVEADEQDEFVADNLQLSTDGLGPLSSLPEVLVNPILKQHAECLILSQPPSTMTEGELRHHDLDTDCPRVDYADRDRVHEIKEEQFELIIQSPKKASAEGTIFVLCFRTCLRGVCNQTLEGLDAVRVSLGNIEIEIDGVLSTGSYFEFDSCHIMSSHEKEHLLWYPATSNHVLKIRVIEEGVSLVLFSVLAVAM